MCGQVINDAIKAVGGLFKKPKAPRLPPQPKPLAPPTQVNADDAEQAAAVTQRGQSVSSLDTLGKLAFKKRATNRNAKIKYTNPKSKL